VRQLGDITPAIGNLQSLQSLNLRYCERLSLLPDTIGKLANLELLSLSLYSLKQIPPTIKGLRNLKRLFTDHGGGCDDPSIINSLSEIEAALDSLEISIDTLRLLPMSWYISPPRRMTKLFLSIYRNSDRPVCRILTFRNLQELDIEHCLVGDQADAPVLTLSKNMLSSMSRLKKLKILSEECCEEEQDYLLKVDPMGLTALKEIEILVLWDCSVSSFPPAGTRFDKDFRSLRKLGLPPQCYIKLSTLSIPSLQYLFLDKCDVDFSLGCEGSHVTFPFLKEMHPDHNVRKIPKKSVYSVLHCPSLEIYEADRCVQLDDEQFERLCNDFFCRCPCLREILLFQSRITMLSKEAVDKLPSSLTVLDLCDCPLLDGNPYPSLIHLLRNKRNIVFVGNDDTFKPAVETNESKLFRILLSLNRAGTTVLFHPAVPDSLWPLVFSDAKQAFKCRYGRRKYQQTLEAHRDIIHESCDLNESYIDHALHNYAKLSSPSGLVTERDCIFQLLRLRGHKEIFS
jgi:hypothetical protein